MKFIGAEEKERQQGRREGTRREKENRRRKREAEVRDERGAREIEA